MKPNELDQPAKILIVDDEPQITRVLRTALSTQGYSIHIAANGVEGMEALHEWRPDLVITDVSMPQMNGVELCREIRAVSQIPIIVLSVRNQDHSKIEALDAGADDYV
ncbi:MAG: response regulator, partial [Edaphobacter sp.]